MRWARFFPASPGRPKAHSATVLRCHLKRLRRCSPGVALPRPLAMTSRAQSPATLQAAQQPSTQSPHHQQPTPWPPRPYSGPTPTPTRFRHQQQNHPRHGGPHPSPPQPAQTQSRHRPTGAGTAPPIPDNGETSGDTLPALAAGPADDAAAGAAACGEPTPAVPAAGGGSAAAGGPDAKGAAPLPAPALKPRAKSATGFTTPAGAANP